ncbi:MAG: hypothetical protein ACYSUP_13300 [Planctomycetota bacterium]
MTENERHPKDRWKPKLYHVFIVLALVVVGFFVLLRFNLKSELEKKCDAIRAAGCPVTCTELDEWYSIPPGSQNAADYFLEAFSYHQQWTGQKRELLPIVSRAELPPRTEALPEETKTVIAQYLAANYRALELLHKAAAIRHSRYPVDFTKGLAVQFSHLPDVRAAAMLLALEAVLHAENAEPQSAIDSITSVFSLARSLSNEPTVISHLVCIACRSLAVQSLEHSLNRVQLTDDQLAGLGRILVEAQDLSAVARAWAGERCQGIEFFNDPVTQPDSLRVDLSLPPSPLVFLYQAAGLSDKDTLIYLDYVEACIKANQLPLHQRRKAVEAAEDELGSVSKIHVLLHKFVPAISRVTELDLTAIAHLRTAQVAVAVERYRLATGALPDTLAGLVPAYLDAVRADPFDGKDLRYKKLEAGFVVYSIGEDETDNGGKEKPPRAKRRGYDITFILER